MARKLKQRSDKGIGGGGTTIPSGGGGNAIGNIIKLFGVDPSAIDIKSDPGQFDPEFPETNVDPSLKVNLQHPILDTLSGGIGHEEASALKRQFETQKALLPLQNRYALEQALSLRQATDPLDIEKLRKEEGIRVSSKVDERKQIDPLDLQKRKSEEDIRTAAEVDRLNKTNPIAEAHAQIIKDLEAYGHPLTLDQRAILSSRNIPNKLDAESSGYQALNEENQNKANIAVAKRPLLNRETTTGQQQGIDLNELNSAITRAKLPNVEKSLNTGMQHDTLLNEQLALENRIKGNSPAGLGIVPFQEGQAYAIPKTNSLSANYNLFGLNPGKAPAMKETAIEGAPTIRSGQPGSPPTFTPMTFPSAAGNPRLSPEVARSLGIILQGGGSSNTITGDARPGNPIIPTQPSPDQQPAPPAQKKMQPPLDINQGGEAKSFGQLIMDILKRVGATK